MVGRTLSFGLFAAAALCRVWDIAAQAPGTTPPVPVAVNETSARAVLVKDAIQLRLLLTGPASPQTRVVAWLLSPSNVQSGETSVLPREGDREANLTLAWPKDKSGANVDEIGWYRIGYRVEVDGAILAKGIFSVGAIASNLLDLRLATPSALVSGNPVSVRVFAGNPVTRAPFRGVHLEARLAIDADTASGPKRMVTRQAITDRSGETIVTFPFPTEPGQTATLTVNGTLTGSAGARAPGALATASISKDFEASDRTTIRVETDKPLHKPGETVHLRALVFNDIGHAAAGKALTLTVEDPESKKLLEVALETNRFGIASYDWKTGPQLAPGERPRRYRVSRRSRYPRRAPPRGPGPCCGSRSACSGETDERSSDASARMPAPPATGPRHRSAQRRCGARRRSPA